MCGDRNSQVLVSHGYSLAANWLDGDIAIAQSPLFLQEESLVIACGATHSRCGHRADNHGCRSREMTLFDVVAMIALIAIWSMIVGALGAVAVAGSTYATSTFTSTRREIGLRKAGARADYAGSGVVAGGWCRGNVGDYRFFVGFPGRWVNLQAKTTIQLREIVKSEKERRRHQSKKNT